MRRFGPAWWLRLPGAGLLLATGAIHLDLYLTGYRAIPTIGPLFLLQAVAAFGLAVAVVATSGWVAAALGAAFAVATLGGYLLSVWVGLFGFREVQTTAGIAAGVVEVAAVGVLASLALPAMTEAAGGPRATPSPGRGMAAARAAVVAAVLASAGLLAAGLATASGTTRTPAGAEPRVRLGTTEVGGVPVLTGPQGLTLYQFSRDSPTRSRCVASCTSIWPPVLGLPVPGPGVQGTFGTITRPGGRLQATYDGHPLYTFAGDAPGTARGNDLHLNGGLWREVIATR